MGTFPPDIEAYVQQKIASGEFRSRDELAAEAIRVYGDLEVKRVQLINPIVRRESTKPTNIDAIKTELIAELDEDGRKI
jgi:Arc/MetJ-type ribon-helix-helix transcriptional regulator